VLQNQFPTYIPALVQARQSIIHIFSCLLLQNARDQMIFHGVQQYPLGLHLLPMSCQFLWIIRTWNHTLNILFEIILLQEKENLALPSLKVCCPFQPVLNLKSVNHCDLPRTNSQNLQQQICCTTKLQRQVSQEDDPSLSSKPQLDTMSILMHLISDLKITSKWPKQ